MNRRILFLAFAALVAGASPASAACDLVAARPWITRWLEAWELTSRDILKLPDAAPPSIVFFDSVCVYTTSGVTAAGASSDGPTLYGARLAWRAAAHRDTLTLPDSSRVPAQLLSFAGADRESGPFFVMAGPSLWARVAGAGEADPGLPVFLHEFAHTRQIRGVRHILGPIDSAWAYPEELTDDAVQTHFGADSAYVAAYLAERDLLERAAAADSLTEARALANEALAMMRRRHARWFTGDKAVFAILDDLFLSMEGAAQWSAAAWLAHPRGGGLERPAVVTKMRGKRRWWSQDEGFTLFLVVDRLLPGWPRLVFAEPSMGALELLERAGQAPSPATSRPPARLAR